MNSFSDDRQGGTRYLRAVRVHWRLIVFLVAVAVGMASTASLLAEKRYEAHADVLVTPVQLSDETFLGIPVLRESDQGRAVLTAARIIETQAIARRVRARLDAQDALRGVDPLSHVDVVPQEQSSVVTIIGKHSTGAGAALIANLFAEELIADRTERFQEAVRAVSERLRARVSAIPLAQREGPEAVAIEQRLGELGALSQDPTVEFMTQASVPARPVWPRPFLSIVVAFLAAMLLSIAVAVALELRNPRFYDEDELLLEQRLPILARIPQMRERVLRRYLSGEEPLPAEVGEAYRTLRANLANVGRDRTFPDVILVTSAMPGEGKTLTSMNLALTIARSGQRVILLDGDLRRPMIASVFGVPAPRKGFASLVLGQAKVAEVLTPAPGYGEQLRLLLSSPEQGYLIDLLQTHEVERILEELRRQSDVIVIDSPPLTEVADALTFVDSADAVLVATRVGHTRRDRLAQLRSMLAQRGVAPTGLVVTTRRRPQKSGYTYASAPPPEALTPAGLVDGDGARATAERRGAVSA